MKVHAKQLTLAIRRVTLGMTLGLTLSTASMLCIPSAMAFELDYYEDRLSLSGVTDVSLGAILQELAVQADVVVEVPAHLVDQQISISFEDLTLEEGVTRILAGTSYTLIHDPSDEEDPPRLSQIWVLSSGNRGGETTPMPGRPAGRTVSYEPATAPLDEDALEIAALEEAVLNGTNPDDRLDAMSELLDVDTQGETAAAAFLSVLKSQASSEVRMTALSLLQTMDASRIPIEAIASVAMRDKDVQLRKLALNFLASSYPADKSHTYLAQAERDSNPEVSALGRWLLGVTQMSN